MCYRNQLEKEKCARVAVTCFVKKMDEGRKKVFIYRVVVLLLPTFPTHFSTHIHTLTSTQTPTLHECILRSLIHRVRPKSIYRLHKSPLLCERTPCVRENQGRDRHKMVVHIITAQHQNRAKTNTAQPSLVVYKALVRINRCGFKH